jgi:hypothetical protein
MGLFSNKNQEKNIFIEPLTFFTFQHCYSNQVLIGLISDQLGRDDANPAFVSTVMKETILLMEIAKKHCLQLLNGGNFNKEYKDIFSDIADIYDLLGIQANAVVDTIDSEGEEKHINIFIQSREKALEKITYFFEAGKKQLESA